MIAKEKAATPAERSGQKDCDSRTVGAETRRVNRGTLRSGCGPPFIPAWLDEAGLNPLEFRAYCRVARRGDCIESLPNMAKGCRIPRVKLQRALKRLVEIGLIRKKERAGDTSKYEVNPDRLPRSTVDLPTQIDSRSTKVLPAKVLPLGLAKRRAYKGSPKRACPCCSLAELESYSKEQGYDRFDDLATESFALDAFKEWTKNGWRIKGQLIRDWRRVIDARADRFDRDRWGE